MDISIRKSKKFNMSAKNPRWPPQKCQQHISQLVLYSE